MVATRNTNIQLKLYNWTTVTQLGIYEVKIEHNNKHKKCNLFVVPGNGQALLGMPDIEILNILNINCNTIGTMETGRAANSVQTQPSSRVQDLSNTIQTQGKKLAGWEGAIQTQA